MFSLKLHDKMQRNKRKEVMNVRETFDGCVSPFPPPNNKKISGWRGETYFAHRLKFARAHAY